MGMDVDAELFPALRADSIDGLILATPCAVSPGAKRVRPTCVPWIKGSGPDCEASPAALALTGARLAAISTEAIVDRIVP